MRCWALLSSAFGVFWVFFWKRFTITKRRPRAANYNVLQVPSRPFIRSSLSFLPRGFTRGSPPAVAWLSSCSRCPRLRSLLGKPDEQGPLVSWQRAKDDLPVQAHSCNFITHLLALAVATPPTSGGGSCSASPSPANRRLLCGPSYRFCGRNSRCCHVKHWGQQLNRSPIAKLSPPRDVRGLPRPS